MIYAFLIAVFVIVAFLLVFVILIQSGKGGGLAGIAGGGMNQLFGGQGSAQRVHVANIPFDEGEVVGRTAVEPCQIAVGALARQVIKHDDVVAAREMIVCQVTADESGAAGDENDHRVTS